MTPVELQFWSLIAVVVIALLNIALIPLIKGAMSGQVEKLRGQFEKMIEVHNGSQYAHPAMTRVAKDEVDRVASNAQSAAAGVATIARDAAASVATTAQNAVAKVAADAQDAVSRVRDGIEKQFEKISGEIRDLRQEISDLRLELASGQHGRIRKAERGSI